MVTTPDAVKMLESSSLFQNFNDLFTSQLNSFRSVLLLMLLHCGMTYLMMCVLAPPLGHFGVNLRHISSTRHTHLSDIFPGCSHGADPELSLDFEPDTVFDLCALESAYMAEIKRYKSSIRIRIKLELEKIRITLDL